MIAARPAPQPMLGLLLSIGGYMLFAGQDAMVKAMVPIYSVPEILLVRSVVIAALSAYLAWQAGDSPAWSSPNKPALAFRSSLMLVAWLCYYSSAAELPLGQLTTLYFVAPVIVVVLSILVLKERVAPTIFVCVGLGFLGTVIAADPFSTPNLWPAAKVLFAAICWAMSVIVVRQISQSETTFNLMFVNSLLFAAVCLVLLPWNWHTPDVAGVLWMVAIGLCGGVGQFLMLEGLRHAPASTLAPTEYSGLVWAFVLGYGFFAEVPTLPVLAGAGLIVAASALLIWHENAKRMALQRAAP